MARSHYQIIGWRSQGTALARIAAVIGYSARWVSVRCRHDREQGAAGLDDQRHTNRGAARLVAADEQALLTALSGPPLTGEGWSGPQVAIG